MRKVERDPTVMKIRIEKVGDFDAECHSCGKVGRPRYLIHFARLCQHFVSLCGICWTKLGIEDRKFRPFRRSPRA